MSATRVAAVQMVSAPEVAPNLEAAERLIAAAAAAGARLVALPENFYLIGRHETDKVAVREADGNGPIQAFLSRAACKHEVWIVAGTVPIMGSDEHHIRGACLVYDSEGKRVARYDKMHLFRFTAGDERYDETRTLEAGDRPVMVQSPFGRLALSVCYDVRYPELYRSLGAFDAMFVPSAFTVPTGAAHWETLLRARAIENLAGMVAPAQSGFHENGRETYGDTMIVDCWGRVQSRLPRGTGVVIGRIDLVRQREVRQNFPVLTHRQHA